MSDGEQKPRDWDLSIEDYQSGFEKGQRLSQLAIAERDATIVDLRKQLQGCTNAFDEGYDTGLGDQEEELKKARAEIADLRAQLSAAGR